MNLAETIFQISQEHLKAGGLILAQNAEAVQNVHNTVPVGEKGVEILPTSETAMAGIAVGAALSGRPVIYVLRFSSFTWLQASPLVNYAAICNEVWDYECPLFVRILAMDGGGPIHTGSMVSILAHRPGLTIAAPCTPNEYREVWDKFQGDRSPTIVSEHRDTFANEGEWWNKSFVGASEDITIIAISNARSPAAQAIYTLESEGIQGSVFFLMFLSPLNGNKYWLLLLESARRTKKVVIADCAYEPCSIAEHVAYVIASETGAKCRVVGMEPRMSGVAQRLENSTPTKDRIIQAVKEMI